ncbi:MAG: amino acid adenylation domain-containing protein [Roseivirga sp.]|nr:amino acid adenylation domain-containing protein [Roseivirga sp.]
MNQTTLVEVLQDAGALKKRGITFIEQGDQEEFLSYQELYRLSLRGLYFLQKAGLKPKDELVFQVENNRAFVILFWSCILGGIVPVPLSIGKNDDQKSKLFNVWSILQSPYLVCTPEHLDRVAKFGLSTGQEHLFARIRGKSIDLNDLDEVKEQGEVHQSKPTDLAFIQFSSGSTGSPKGVMLSHENLITNVAAIAGAAAYSLTDSTLSWMPLTHDMGLIGFHINPLFSRMNQCLMPTTVFVRKPTLWLTKATEHQTTVICSPNFGYKYLLKYLDENKEYPWDLSRIRIIYNGAEPISEQLARTFVNALTKYGLCENTMRPVYGLAEASLAVSISDLKTDIISLALDRIQLHVGNPITASNAENALSFVNVGRAINEVSIRITDASGKRLKEEVIGHVKIKGKNVTAGYYNNPEATQKAVSQDGWLDTGDLGFMKDGALYITGRAKDIFFVNGQNFYPHDLERLAEVVDGVDLNKVIISGAPDGVTEAVIAFVFHRGDVDSFIPVSRELKAHINMEAGVELTAVIPVKDIPKTTSGKLQRFKLMEKYRSGDFDLVIQEMQLAERDLAEAGRVNEQPQNEVEQRLLDMWEELFGMKGLSVTDKFFEIGGNSLKAAEFAMSVLKKFELELPLAQLYDRQSIRDITGVLDSLQKAKYEPIPDTGDSDRHPASALQRRLFYFQETNPDATAYNVPVAFETDVPIDADRLHVAARQMVARYDTLRSTFFEEGQELFINVHDQVDFQIESVDSDISDPDFTASLVTPFDLKKPGLFRMLLIIDGTGKNCLFLDFHHIVMDGVSISFFVEELSRLYQGEKLKAPFTQYIDFAHWSEKQWDTDNYEEQKQYWLNELAGELPQLEMPLDRPRPGQFDHAGEKLSFKLSKAKSIKLRELSKKNGCSMHALMLTAYQVLLHKYTGQSVLITGLPVTLRNHPDVSRSLGMFVNNLAIKHSIESDETFETLLEKLAKQVEEALTQEYPFDLLLNELSLKRDISRNPVFDTMFLYQNMDQPTSGSDALVLKSVTIPSETSKFDISQEVFNNGTGPLTYSFEYATALFDRETIHKMAVRYDALLDRLLLNPQSKISDISLLSVDEYQKQVFGFNDSARVFKGQTVLDLIEGQITASPEAIAVAYGEMELSYQTLAEQSDLVAAALLADGLKKGDVVAIYMDRSANLIVGMLGIIKSGGVFLPIDTELPEKRVQYLLSHSRCQWALTSYGLKSQLSDWSETEVQVMVVSQLVRAKAPLTADSAIDSPDLAYLLYTSGTTGNPKGVMVSHKALHNYASWAAEKYVGNESGSFPLFTSISFDLTLTSVFTPLITGNAIVIYNDDEVNEQHMVIRALKDNQVDIIKLTPSHLRLLRDVDLSELGEIRLQKMILGGEALDTGLAREISEKFNGKVSLFNEYGPTESTVGCMIHQFDPEEVSMTVPIGVPAANTQIYLLDKHLQLVPDGVKGELYISGTGLASGYWLDEPLSAEKFLSNPYAENERIYKTGDLARRRADGTLEFLGRTDEQLKINGYRIELDEINHHLRAYPGVRDSVVIPRDIQERKSLFAYTLTYKSHIIEEAVLKNHLATLLPFYMIPVRIVSLEAFPMTDNGKLDRQALTEMVVAAETAVGQLPTNELEKLFAAAWQEVLGVDDIAVTDNFFELGGDSIKAVQIASRLHEKKISVPVKDLLTYHTIAQLVANAKYAQSGQRAQQGVVLGTKAKTPIESWFFNQHFANPSFYNQSVLLNTNQALDLGMLRKAFKTLIAHHDGLRINYNSTDQILFFNERHLNADFHIPERQLEDDFSGQLLALKSGFDLAESLLLKAVVFVEGGRQKYLFVTAHHLVTDGISWRILLHDLSKVYVALVNGQQSVLPPKTVSLVEWQCQLSAWQPENEDLSKQYWDHVKGQAFALPLDFANTDWGVNGLRQHRLSLREAHTDYLIKEAHKAYQTDVFTLLNVVLAQTLHDWTGERHFVIEHESHGRHLDDCDVSRTIGWFTAMYPVQLAWLGDDLKEQIKAIKEQIRQVPDHGLSYGLQAQRSVDQDLEKQSEIRFNYLGEFVLEGSEQWSFSGKPIGPETASNNHLTTKLELNALVMNGQFILDMSYHKGTFKEETIGDFGLKYMNHLVALLEQIRQEGDVHFTPSDFEASLDQQELDELFM